MICRICSYGDMLGIAIGVKGALHSLSPLPLLSLLTPPLAIVLFALPLQPLAPGPIATFGALLATGRNVFDTSLHYSVVKHAELFYCIFIGAVRSSRGKIRMNKRQPTASPLPQYYLINRM